MNQINISRRLQIMAGVAVTALVVLAASAVLETFRVVEHT